MDKEQLERFSHAIERAILALDTLPKQPGVSYPPILAREIKAIKRKHAKGCPKCGYELVFDHEEEGNKWYCCTRPGCSVMITKK